jgi:TolA-binding protein
MNYNHLLFGIFSLIIIVYLGWQSNSKTPLVEPLENKTDNNTCSKDPLFLAMKNASEISILKDQVKQIEELKQKINVIETNTNNNTKYIDVVQQQYSNEANDIQTATESPDELDETQLLDEE